MTAAQRCDEILHLIDEIISNNPDIRSPPAHHRTRAGCRPRFVADRGLTATWRSRRYHHNRLVGDQGDAIVVRDGVFPPQRRCRPAVPFRCCSHPVTHCSPWAYLNALAHSSSMGNSGAPPLVRQIQALRLGDHDV